MRKVWVYQINGGAIYSSRNKAHQRLCDMVGRNEDEFLPYKERVEGSKTIISYPNGNEIHQRPLL